MLNQRINLQYVLIAFVTVLLTWFIHEFGHYIVYKSLGYDAFMSFNKAGIRGSEVPSIDQQILGTATGPIVTVLQALIAFLILRNKGWNKYIYLFLFAPFYMRFLAGLMNFISPNDEGVISKHFGLGLFTISVVVSALLFWWVYRVSKKYKLKSKFQLLTTILVLVFSSILILIDQFFRLQLL